MPEGPGAAGREARVRELLLGHLQSADLPPWPGADGLTLEDALLSYPQAAAAGRAPDLRRLLRDHPELAEELTAFFGAAAGRGAGTGSRERAHSDGPSPTALE
jgi:hypothetical protein